MVHIISNLPILLHGSEKWYLTLTWERSLRVLGNWIQSEYLGPKWDENWERRRLHNEERLSLNRPPNVVRVIKCKKLKRAGNVARTYEGGSVFKILTGTSTVNRPLGKLRRKWEDNIRMDFKEIGIGLIRLRIGIIGEHLWIRHSTPEFHRPWS